MGKKDTSGIAELGRGAASASKPSPEALLSLTSDNLVDDCHGVPVPCEGSARQWVDDSEEATLPPQEFAHGRGVDLKENHHLSMRKSMASSWLNVLFSFRVWREPPTGARLRRRRQL